MAHLNRIFSVTPAIYPTTTTAPQRRRRTATNVMAGSFDLIPTFATENDTDRSHSSVSRTTPVATAGLFSDPAPTAFDARRPRTKKGKRSEAKRPGGIVPLIGAPDTSVSDGKSKGKKRAVPGDMENEDAVMSDGESSWSHSRPLRSPTHKSADPGPSDLLTVRPKVSGFGGGRSSKGSDAPSLKRNHSPPDNTQPPSLGSLTSVSSPLKLPQVSDSHAEKPTASVFQKIPAVQVARDSQPPARKKGPRKNTLSRRGWKGWVEGQLSPRNLILLDKPEVLPERTTRSGRKID